MKSAISRTRSTSKLRQGLVLGVVGVAVAGLTLVVATSASANLSGSTFEGGDGNLVVNTTGNTDWANVDGLNKGIDKASGSSDNAFGQGTKEDNPQTTVVNGSIPPNKNDLTRFYEASEQVSGGDIFLYLGWERLVNIGNANLDFEINQNATTGFTKTATGPITLNRTAGDLLVTYDFGGSGTPTLGLLRWLTSTSVPVVTDFATNACFSANSFPCWGDRVNLSGLGEAEAKVNTGTVTDPIAPNAPRSLGTGLFGEAAINLTDAGVFGSGCTAFGTAFLKSRSSSSFTAELKDFIAPIDVSISNCGSVIVRKVTEGGDDDFGYTSDLTPASFTMSDGGSQSFGSNVTPGNYSVTETLTADQIAAGWTLEGIDCSATTGTGTTATPDGSGGVDIVVANGGAVDCTFTNHLTASPTIATAQNLIPNDDLTLSGATTAAGGTVTFNLYDPSDATCDGTPAYTETVDVSGNDTYSTTNTLFIASDEGTWRWESSYSGDDNNNPAESTCGTEQFTISNS